MRVTEIAYRGWQEASKWFDQIAPLGRTLDPETLLREEAPALADPEQALRVLRVSAPQRFFAGAADPAALVVLHQRLEAECRDLIASADAMLNRRFDLLGYRGLSFGDPIDWHLDPVSQRRSPADHWSRIDPLNPAIVGDSKVVWELNRHQWLVRLAQARALTGDDRYAESCVSAIDAWLETNPPGVGINWTSSLEVAFRLMSWSWMLVLLRESPSVTGSWVMKMLAAVWHHATHVRRYLSYYYSPNTHLTGEALGLLYAGLLFPEFRDADRWREAGLRILIDQSEAQTLQDGVHFEQSTCYHRYFLDTYLHLLLLADRHGIELPQTMVDRVKQMTEFLFAVRQPDGSIPVIGDADCGALMPLAAAAADSRGVFATAAVIFRRSEFAWAANGIRPDVFWLTGLEGVAAFDRIAPAQPSSTASRVFPSGGYAVMRTGWEPTAHQIIVDIGPLGCPISSGHGHADLLSIQGSVFGAPCFVDAGTYCYTADAEWRDFFRGTATHSTVMIDGAGQSEPAGPFGWRRRPRVKLREWHSHPDFDFLDAEHDAYRGLPDPVVHRRRVIFVKPSYWLLVDDLSGASRHQVELTFQFAPIAVTLGPHPWARASVAGGRALWISPFPAAPVQASVKCGELLPTRGWISTEYGQRTPAPMLVYSSLVVLPWRILTLLLPDPQGLLSPPGVRPIYDEKGLPTGLTFDRPRRSVRLSEHAVVVERE